MESNATNTTERITTLLEDRLPLDRDRDLKTPVIAPGDDAVRIRLKLGRYLLRSLAADADPLAVADAAAARLMPGMRRLEAARVAADGELAAHADRDMARTGAPDAVYSDGTRILFVSMGGHRPAVNRIGYRFRSSGRPLDTVSLSDLMAADAIGAAMPALPDGDARRRLVSAMLDDDRGKPDVAGLTDPVHPSVLALSVLGHGAWRACPRRPPTRRIRPHGPYGLRPPAIAWTRPPRRWAVRACGARTGCWSARRGRCRSWPPASCGALRSPGSWTRRRT